MVSSQRKKRLYLAVGLMVVLILALVWHAGQYLQGSQASRKESHQADAKTRAIQVQPVVVTKKISASGPDEAHAGGGDQPAVVRKKLPPLPPAPAQKAEPQPAVAAPAPAPAAVVEGRPQPPLAPETKPAAAASPAPEAPLTTAATASPPASAPPAVQAMPAPSSKPGPPKTIARATPSGHGAYPFSLLLSSNRGKANAQTTLPDYRRKGLAPYLAYTDLGEKGKWWRTLYGCYPTLEDALQAKHSLNLSEAVVVKTPFANLVGEYPSEKEAAEAAAQLSQKGLFPYTVKGPQNSTRLMAGAFPTRQEAEQQQRELEALGIAVQTIQR